MQDSIITQSLDISLLYRLFDPFNSFLEIFRDSGPINVVVSYYTLGVRISEFSRFFVPLI